LYLISRNLGGSYDPRATLRKEPMPMLSAHALSRDSRLRRVGGGGIAGQKRYLKKHIFITNIIRLLQRTSLSHELHTNKKYLYLKKIRYKKSVKIKHLQQVKELSIALKFQVSSL